MTVEKNGSVVPHLLLLALLTFVAFANSLGNGFTMDDFPHVVENPMVQNPDNFSRIATAPTWPGNLYRPVVTWSYALTNRLAGNAPFAYHLGNVLLHLAVVVLLFLLAERTVGRSFALIAAALFAVHPIHVEAVASIANRTELLSTMFGLGGMLFVLGRNDDGAGLRALVLGAVCFTLAFLSKESALVFALLVPLVFFVKAGFFGGLRSSVRPLLVVFIAAGVSLALRVYALGALSAPSYEIPFLDNPLVALPLAERVLSAIALFGKYLLLFILPWPLTSDYSYAMTGSIHAMSNSEALQLVGLVGVFLGVAVCGVWRRQTWTWWMLWVVIAFAITSNVLFPIGTAFSERLAYLPSVGWCLVIAQLISALSRASVRSTVAAAVVLLYVLLTVTQNRVWASNETLYRHAAFVSPYSAKAQHNYGIVLRNRGQLPAADKQFRRALATYPKFAKARYGIATVHLLRGEIAAAEQWLLQVLTLDANHGLTLIALGRINFNRGQLDVAEKFFERALENSTEKDQALLGLFGVLVASGRYDKAKQIEKILLQRRFSHPDFDAFRTQMAK